MEVKDDFTQIYYVDTEITIRKRLYILGDNATDIENEINEKAEDILPSGFTLEKINIRGIEHIGKYNLEEDEEILF